MFDMKKILITICCLWSFALKAEVIVVDGDSLLIDGRRVRLEGIDAPEYNQNCYDANGVMYKCGQKAKEALAETVKSGVKCQKMNTDIYQREVSICYAGKVNINQQMVRNGWAVAYTRYFPDFALDEENARKEKRGIWKGRFMRPDLYRALETDKVQHE